MNLNWKEADFIMHCMEVFADGDKEFSFAANNGRDILLTTKQIEDLFQRVQQIKFHDLDMEYERRIAMAD